MSERYVRADLADRWPEDTLIARVRGMEGTVYRSVAGRRTMRVNVDGRAFFLKTFEGVGWLEIFKNWLVLKKPVIGARNEYEACRHLEANGIAAPRVAAFAEEPGSIARRFSFVMCDELGGYEDLEAVALQWLERPPPALELQRTLVRVAQFARRFHGNGVAHRDFYLCHLLRPVGRPDLPLAVLDLHRARVFPRLPDRWRMRDLAALLHSAMDLPLDRRSWLRFVRIYSGRPLRDEFAARGHFWRAVQRRADRLYRKSLRKGTALAQVAR